MPSRRSASTTRVTPGTAPSDAAAVLTRVAGVTRVVESDRRDGMVGYEIDSESGRDVRRDLARAIVNSGWGLLEMRPMRMSLEDVFLSLTTEEVPTPAAEANAVAEGEMVHE